MTSLATWRPVRGLSSIHNEMSRFFDDRYRPTRYRAENGSLDWLPAVDILEAEDNVEIRAEIPGLSEKDVHVSVKDDVLTLKGEKKHETVLVRLIVDTFSGVEKWNLPGQYAWQIRSATNRRQASPDGDGHCKMR